MSLIPNLKYTDEGVEAPTIEALQDGLWRVMEKAFGGNLNRQWSTPQGQLVASLSAEFSAMQGNIIELMNLVDPQFSSGVMQDAIGEIYFLKRKKATRSIVQLTFRGLSGKVIPKGFTVSDINGNEWRTTESKFIATDGSIAVLAEAVEAGAIEANSGEIVTIVNNMEGVDSVTNITPAIVGRDTESREEFEERRKESVAKNSKNMNASVFGEVSDLDGVVDCHVVDNPTDETITAGFTGYSLIRNSVAVSVVGGDDNAIARAILTKAGSGCSFVGETVVEYLDRENYESLPPKYEVKFIRPKHIPVYFTVQVENFGAIGYAQEQFIKNRIIDAFRSGKLRAGIGKKVIANRYMCRIADVENNVIMGIFVGRSKEEKTNVLDFGIDEFPVISPLSISIEGYDD